MKQLGLIKSGGSSVTRAVVLDVPIQADLNHDVLAFRAASCRYDRHPNWYSVYLRVSGTNVQLVPKSDDGSSEGTAVNLATNLAQTYSVDFKILKVHYVSMNMVIIEYQYPTSATADSAITIRPVLIAAGGSGVSYGSYAALILGAAVAISAVTSATVDVEAYLLRGLFANYFSVRKAITTSTGALALASYVYYENYSTPALTANSTAMVNLSSNVNVKLLSPLSKCPCARGGFTYANSSSAKKMNIIFNYQTTKNIDLSTFISTTQMNATGLFCILGFLTSGYLVIAFIPNDVSRNIGIYMGTFDYNTGGSFQVCGGTWNGPIDTGITADNKILAFQDDILLFSNGKRLKLLKGVAYNAAQGLKILDPVEIEHKSVLGSGENFYVSSESDPFTGVFVY